MTRMDARDQRQLETRTVGRLGFRSLGKGIGWTAVDGSVIGGAGAGSRPGYRAGQQGKQRAVIGSMSDPQACFLCFGATSHCDPTKRRARGRRGR